MSNSIFKYKDEDDGTRIYTNDGCVLCNRCNAVMQFMEDMDEMVSYYYCPECEFIEIDEYYIDQEEENYILGGDDY